MSRQKWLLSRSFFGLQLGYRLYAINDNLSKVLQEKKMSAAWGQCLARATLPANKAMRNDESFDITYEHLIKKAEGHMMVQELKKEASNQNQNIIFWSMLMAIIKGRHIKFGKSLLKQLIIL